MGDPSPAPPPLEAQNVATDGPRAPFPLAHPQNVDRYVPAPPSVPTLFRYEDAETEGGAVDDRRRRPFDYECPKKVNRYVPPPLPSPAPSRADIRLKGHARRNTRDAGAQTDGKGSSSDGCEAQVGEKDAKPNGSFETASSQGDEARDGEESLEARESPEGGKTLENGVGSPDKKHGGELPRYWLVLEDIPILDGEEGR